MSQQNGKQLGLPSNWEGENKYKHRRKFMILQINYTALNRALCRQFSRLRTAALTVILMSAFSALASTYTVNCAWTDDGSSPVGSPNSRASLIGTVQIPDGVYVLDKNSPSPFTAVNLTLNMSAEGETLAIALTEAYPRISGNAKVIIRADGHQLTFQHSNNASSAAAAVVQFWDPDDLACYALGQDSVVDSEMAFCGGIFVVEKIVFPEVFGVVQKH
jgi:hypothetical protein